VETGKKAKLVVNMDEREAKILRKLAVEDGRDVADMVIESLRARFGGRMLPSETYPVSTAVAS